ncbi:MAG: metal-dependent transcriptional regulator [Deinococcota bacterium]
MPNLKDATVSTSMEDYLKAIWLVAGDGSASTNELAKQLGISAASVSAMLKKLCGSGFVKHQPYKGVQLTKAGIQQALHLLRRHRLIETFLLEHLGFSWEDVHEEAEELEHVVSDYFTEQLAAFLGHPSHDPHGDPIPRLDGYIPDTPNTPLAELAVGKSLTVSRLMSQAEDVLTYLAELGIQPGSQLKLIKREPLGGLVHVVIKHQQMTLSKELAMLIRGEVRP